MAASRRCRAVSTSRLAKLSRAKYERVRSQSRSQPEDGSLPTTRTKQSVRTSRNFSISCTNLGCVGLLKRSISVGHVAKARTWSGSEDLKSVMSQAGVIGKPEIYVID